MKHFFYKKIFRKFFPKFQTWSGFLASFFELNQKTRKLCTSFFSELQVCSFSAKLNTHFDNTHPSVRLSPIRYNKNCAECLKPLCGHWSPFLWRAGGYKQVKTRHSTFFFFFSLRFLSLLIFVTFFLFFFLPFCLYFLFFTFLFFFLFLSVLFEHSWCKTKIDVCLSTFKNKSLVNFIN